MGKDVYRVTVDGRFLNAPPAEFHKRYAGAFCYSKVSVDDVGSVRSLEDKGFRLVDTNVVYEKKVGPKAIDLKDAVVRLARGQDKEKVKALAGRCFHYSRFHLDPAIPPDIAHRIKAEWAGNFFEGRRGQVMIVTQKGNDIVGFLQLLDDRKGTLTIDLLGVDENCRRQGLAAGMISYAQTQPARAVKIRVGTQLANIPSIHCYEQLGFCHTDASYVFHYHGRPRT